MSHNHEHDDDHDDFGGLQRDLRATGAAMGRRRALGLAARFGAGLGVLQLLGCASAADAVAPETDTNGTGGDGACTRVPEETAGPYPADASNGPNVLNQAGVVRNDIRSSFAGLSGTAAGV